MNKLKQILLLGALVFAGLYGMTLSWILLAGVGLCLGVAALVSCGEVRIRAVDGILVIGVIYFGWRAACSPVWDLAKEDILLMVSGLLVYWIFRERKFTDQALWMIFCLGLINAVYFFMQKSGMKPWSPLVGVSERSLNSEDFGLFQDYGALGNAMAMSAWVIFSNGIWSAGKTRRYRLLVIGCAILVSVVALLSGSRSAILSFGVGGMIFALASWLSVSQLSHRLQSRVRALICSGGVVGLIFVAVLGYMTFSQRAGESGDQAPGIESNIRTSYWGMAIEQALESPVIGTGARSFSYESIIHWDGKLKSIEANPEFAHNEYLQTFGDYGFIGLLILLGVLGVHCVSGFYHLYVHKNDRTEAEVDWRIIAGLTGLSVAVVNSFTDFPLRLPLNFILAAICLAWCMPVFGGANGGKGFLRGRSWGLLLRGLVAALALFAVGFGGRELWGGMPLMEVRQVREDGEWTVEGKGNDVSLYEEANRRSPDFRRLLHLGQLQHERFIGGDMDAFSKAESAYLAVRERNTYDFVGRINLAALYSQRGMYAESDREFSKSEGLAGARDWWVEFYLKWGGNSIAEGDALTSEGRYSQAAKEYSRAVELLGKGTSKSLPRQELVLYASASQVRLAILEKDYDGADAAWEECLGLIDAWIFQESSVRPHRGLGYLYYDAGMAEWRNRKPDVAARLFGRALYFLKGDRQIDGGVPRLERHDKIMELEKALGVLQDAGF